MIAADTGIQASSVPARLAVAGGGGSNAAAGRTAYAVATNPIPQTRPVAARPAAPVSPITTSIAPPAITDSATASATTPAPAIRRRLRQTTVAAAAHTTTDGAR